MALGQWASVLGVGWFELAGGFIFVMAGLVFEESNLFHVQSTQNQNHTYAYVGLFGEAIIYILGLILIVLALKRLVLQVDPGPAQQGGIARGRLVPV